MRDTLINFTTLPLVEASEALLDKLGIVHATEVRGSLFDDHFKDHDFSFQYVEEAKKCVEHIWHIGYVLNSDIQQNADNPKYDTLSIFACEIKPDANFTRSIAVDLTRAFNRAQTRKVDSESLEMPVIVIMKQGSLLSIGTCERSDRKDGAGEKVGRVTILRNINCQKPHPGHCQILQRVANDVCGCSTYEELHHKWFKSFNIDVLSDAFFDGYKSIYEDIIEYVTGKRMVKESNKWVEHDNGTPCVEIMAEFAHFADPEKTVRDYVKNLMGRLVFIQFLQKKGWMGVPAGDSWNGGDPEFLQNLFLKSDKKETFVDDVLEPLFNDLNTDRHGNLVTNQNVGVNIKVPYLNGGLFELDETDDTKFPLPTKFFWNFDDDNAKKHPGILRFFSEYNFTIDENAPDNVEIGVDPEMLGRIFENLLEDNKEKGAFYTPKEIVQYMCRESLIAYLTTCVMKKQGENHQPEEKIHDAVRKLLSEPETIVPRMTLDQLDDFGNYIRNVKICDPAIGSGAFPMGLLNELVRCRAIIKAWAKDAYGNLLYNDYAALKAEIICNNIYGVDIEKGAIDIARLRFWLSIIVDLKVPHALPNFDYKFMQGNSLITTFNGEYVNLDTKKQKHIKVEDMKKEKQRLYGLKQQYYGSQGKRKHELAVEIKKSILRLVSMQKGYELRSWVEKNTVQTSLDFDGQKANFADIKSQLPQDMQDIVNHTEGLYRQLNDTNVDITKRALIDISFFDWKMMFTEVFDVEDGNGGFDIVIGNPPYIQLQANGGRLANLYKPRKFKTFSSEGDIYCLFYEYGYKILKSNGTLCYITSNKWMRTGYGEKTRTFIKDNTYPRILIDFIRTKLFDDATVETNILLFTKEAYYADTKCSALIEVKKKDRNQIGYLISKNSYDWYFDNSAFWTLSNVEMGNLKSKIKKVGTPLEKWDLSIFRGVLTGFNNAYIISSEQKDNLLKNCRNSDERERTEALMRHIIRGKDVGVYLNNWESKWIVNVHNGVKYSNEENKTDVPRIEIDDYPTLKEFLDNYRDQLIARADQGDTYYNLRNCAYLFDFDKPKIIWKRIGSILRFAYDEKKSMCLDSTCFATGEHLKFLLAFFNSKIGHFMLQDSPKTGTGDLLISVQAIEPLCVPKPEVSIEETIESNIDSILSSLATDKDSDISVYTSKIDQLLYELYGLTNAEVKIIDPNEIPSGPDNQLFKA